jgi:hypothetical protein
MLNIDKLLMVAAIVLVIGMSLAILFQKNRQTWYKNAPSLITTTGIFCTFIGVTVGLLRFSPDNSDSLKFLLDGLKLAFIPSAIAIFISILFKWLHTHSYTQNLGNNFISKIEENTVAINRLVDAVQVVDWQIAYKQSLEANIDKNAELLAVIETSLKELIEVVNEQPKQLIDSSKNLSVAIEEVSTMVNQTTQDLKNTLTGLGMNIKKAMTNIEQNSQSPLTNVYNDFNKFNQTMQQLQGLSSELSTELKSAVAEHVRSLEAVISNELQKTLAKYQQ